MRIAIPKEMHPVDKRISLTPSNVKKLIDLGAEVDVESELGLGLSFTDDMYRAAGASVVDDRSSLLQSAGLVVRLHKPAADDIELLKPDVIHIGHLEPFSSAGLIKQLAGRGVTAISMEMIPRTTLAQKMDALSSQASLAGYAAVILAAEKIMKIFPMMMTPAGTIPPARVFVIGAGVAGLQAIATAKRLGARVEAYDTRPVVEEQVQSLGAKFVKLNLGDTGQTKDGYAKTLSEDQIARQREGMVEACARSDVVITTAQVFGRKAPVIITNDMIQRMDPGSIIVDMAVETGGNVEGSALDREVDINGVTIIGFSHLPSRVAIDASQMYSNNLFNFINEFWNSESKTFEIDPDHEIIKGCLLTHKGRIVNDRIRKIVEDMDLQANLETETNG